MNLLIDLDDTVSDAAWRETLKDDGFEFYHSQLIRDPPIREVLNLVNGLHFAGWMIHAITARPESFRELTLRQLVAFRAPIARVLMRADNDKRRSPDVKMDLVLNNFSVEQRQFAIAIDDREDVCIAYRSMGLTALQVHRRPTDVQTPRS